MENEQKSSFVSKYVWLIDFVFFIFLVIKTGDTFLTHVQSSKNDLYLVVTLVALLGLTIVLERCKGRQKTLQNYIAAIPMYIWVYRVMYLYFLFLPSADLNKQLLYVAYVIQYLIVLVYIKKFICNLVHRNTLPVVGD